jgi:hypothetical protein
VVNAIAGVATFSNLSINRIGTGYSLAASSSGLASTVSNSFNVAPGAPSQLAFLTQPSGGTSNIALSPAVRVAVQDAGGNTVTGSSLAVSVALGSSGSATLSGTTTVNASVGVATFSDLRIDKVGSYTLVFSAAGLSSAISNPFSITPGPASALAITTGPGDGTAGTALSPAIRVEVQDDAGNAVTGAYPVTAALGSNPGGGTLLGTLTRTASGGVATFGDLRLERSGFGYTLTFTSGLLAPVTSDAFSIASGPAATLAFTTQPQGTPAGNALAPVRVSLQDAYGNIALGSSASVTVELASAPPDSPLLGTTTVTASSGVATFSDLRLEKVGSYTLSGFSGGLPRATSSAFTISPGAAARLAFTVQPSSVENGAPIAPAAKVAVQDTFGNTVTTATDVITMVLSARPAGGTLSGNTAVAATGGEAAFSNLRIDIPGDGYALRASSGTLAPATSDPFTVILGHVRGSRIAHHRTHAGQVDVPADLSAFTIAAHVLQPDGSFTYYPGAGTDAGTFEIPGVPHQPYYLQFNTVHLVTSARNVDFDFKVQGRPDTEAAGPGTTLSMDLTGMSPWTSDPMDTLQVFSANAGTWIGSIMDYGVYPAHGDTAINQTVDYTRAATEWGGTLPNAAKGDQVAFLHTNMRHTGFATTDGGVVDAYYLAAVDVFNTSTLTIQNGGDAGVSGAFSPVPQRNLRVDWKLAEATPGSYGSYREAVSPGAESSFLYFYLSTLPEGAYGPYGASLDLIAMEQLPQGADSDQSVDYTYGNPFPDWAAFSSAYVYFRVRQTVPRPDAGTVLLSTFPYIRSLDLLAGASALQLEPGVSPPRSALINGTPSYVNQTIGTTPTVSWQPPARGTPTYYALRFRNIFLNESGLPSFGAYTGPVWTSGTSVRVPPGLLETGKMYVMYLSAFVTPVSIETAPYTRQFPLHEAIAIGGVLTVQ